MLDLSPEFAAQLPATTDPFDAIMRLDGELYRDMDNRRTLRFTLKGRRYFLKAHYGVGWREILKNLLQLKLPVLGARNEWLAIRRLESLGIDTMRLVGCGERGWNPARRESFVITEALEETCSLEDFCAVWETTPPATGAEIRLKRALIDRVARVARLMHGSGMNHRDFYLCHFLLDCAGDVLQLPPGARHLYLIDLHRVQLRRRTPPRWLVKDIGGLYFSAMRIGLTRRDLYRFMAAYRNRPLRRTLDEDAVFWARCRRRAHGLYHAYYHEQPPSA
ncbi:MAG TPA: lipopolysaccharide core heptose(I) kinase RfaP [Gammaproteobacteria bacterium]|nr:lipopolysaccharide core heptose(I) kinase RfaP [Gammaproteobacteria bacterium]